MTHSLPPAPTPAATRAAAVERTDGRLGWIDVGRGAIMLTVVVLHVGLYQMLPAIAADGGAAYVFWNSANGLLGAVRMPALLIISGWLAASTLHGGVRSPRTRRRVLTNAWLFVLWMGVYSLVTAALHADAAAQSVPFATLPRQLLLPDSTLWFLAALVWYTLGLAALRRLPRGVVLGALLLVAAVTDTLLGTQLGLWVKIPQFAFYFALGAYAKPAWTWVAGHPRIALPAGLATSWAAVEWENYQTQVTHEWSFASATVLSLALAVCLFAAAGVIAGHVPVLARPLELVGRNTVAVYVLHFPLLLVLSHVPVLSAALADVLAVEPVRWVFPLLLTAAITALSLTVKHVTEELGAGWLWRLPARPAMPAVEWEPRRADAQAS